MALSSGCPGETFALQPYVAIAAFADEAVLGKMLLGVSLPRMAVLGINGTLRRGSPHLRALFAGASAVVWSILLTGYLASDVNTLMLMVSGWAVAIEFFNIARAATRAAKEDAEARNGRNGHHSG